MGLLVFFWLAKNCYRPKLTGMTRSWLELDLRWNRWYYRSGLHPGTKYSGHSGRNGTGLITLVCSSAPLNHPYPASPGGKSPSVNLKKKKKKKRGRKPSSRLPKKKKKIPRSIACNTVTVKPIELRTCLQPSGAAKMNLLKILLLLLWSL